MTAGARALEESDTGAGRSATSRTVAALVALPLLIMLWLAAVFLPVPYVVYSPGVTVDVLASVDGDEIIQVSGHQVYRDDGQLRMTTVYVTQPEGRVNLFQAMWAWMSDEEAVLPRESVYPPDTTAEDSRRESAVEMVSSQDAAIAVALTQLGYDVEPVIEVLNVDKGLPAYGKLKVRDVLVSVDGKQISRPEDVRAAVEAGAAGQPLRFAIERDDKPMTVSVAPENVEGELRVGVVPGPGYEFPFQVTVNIDPDIGGPSAGLMFSLGIYDTLTPGSLTDDQTIAGTGTIDAEGRVGTIGGIQQKIVAARDAGAELFLVPAGNCAEALGAPTSDMRLVRVDTMPAALEAIQAWTADEDADLPACRAGEG